MPDAVQVSQQHVQDKRIADEMLATRAGYDVAAFTELYERYLCKVRAFIQAHVRDGVVADDLTAQVFFKALNSADTFRGEGSYQAWLFRIARNCLATWRHRDARRTVVLEEFPEERDPSPSPAAHLVIKEARNAVWDEIVALPESQREAVLLRYIHDLPIEEVARRTARTHGAVRILLHRARARLRKALEGRDVS